jgi:hypothetical protein
MEKITHKGLALKLATIECLEDNKATWISLRTETKQNKLNKGKGTDAMSTKLGINPEEIFKHSTSVVLVGSNYEKMVNNRLKKECAGTGVEVVFESQGLKGRTWVEGAEGKVMMNAEGEYLIRTYPVSNNKPTSNYIHKGAEIDLNDPKFNPYRKPDSSKGSNQGLDNPVPVNDYKFASIKQITISGVTYDVIPD